MFKPLEIKNNPKSTPTKYFIKDLPPGQVFRWGNLTNNFYVRVSNGIVSLSPSSFVYTHLRDIHAGQDAFPVDAELIVKGDL